MVNKENGVMNKGKIVEKVDILNDIRHPELFPWKYRNKSVKEITCIGVFEYLNGKLRGEFMDEIYRILTDDGSATFVVPNWSSDMAFHDYMYEWPPICLQSFLMFNKEWRETNKKNVDIVCDFDFTYGAIEDAETATKSDIETKGFYIKHYNNSVSAWQIVLTKRLPK